MRAAGGDVVGLDWRVDLDTAWTSVGHDVAVQGNLDPAVLLAKPPYIRQRVKDILDRAGGRPGHIFNLGHGSCPRRPSSTSGRSWRSSTSCLTVGYGESGGHRRGPSDRVRRPQGA